MNEKNIIFDPIIKRIGTSAGIIIPTSHLKYLGLNIGDTITVSLQVPKYKNLPKEIIDIYRKHLKNLADFTDKEFNKFMAHLIKEQRLIKEGKLNKATIEAYEEGISNNEDPGFIERYRVFKSCMTNENIEKVLKDLDPEDNWKKLIQTDT